MGWTSYLEDITERLTDDLRAVEQVLADPVVPQQRKLNAVLEWHGRAKRVLLELRRDMDIATDPDLDIAAEVISLEKRRNELFAENARLELEQKRHEAEVTALKASQAELDAKIAALKETLKQEKKRNDKLQDAIRADPGPLYDKFTTPDRLKIYERDDD